MTDSRIGIAGVDTGEQVNSKEMIDDAHRLMGTLPKFWGRYFLGKEYEYKHNEENELLRNNGIRVLPICRETGRVSHSDLGEQTGNQVIEDILATFGEDYLASNGGSFFVFLDIEPDPEHPPLSTEYYLGWSKAVVTKSSKVKFLPCIYLSQKNNPSSFSALKRAIEQGAECHGLWIAHYWDNPLLQPWSEERTQPPIDLDCPVLIHQYAGDHTGVHTVEGTKVTYDFNQINPSLDMNSILHRLILPQPV